MSLNVSESETKAKEEDAYQGQISDRMTEENFEVTNLMDVRCHKT